jgi:hypothetical protein
MKRVVFLATVVLLLMLAFAPVALAQDDQMQEGTPGVEATPGPLPPSGGPAILLPAAALLLGSGILTYAVLRRR